MALFQIPDIRLFWSEDARFMKQFEGKTDIVKFKEFSKYPAVYKDISFWVPAGFVESDFFELIRTVAGTLIEDVQLIDQFQHPTHGLSKCYRLLYRSMDRTLENQEIDVLQSQLCQLVQEKLRVHLR
jgi:phenylalanyl-tRNA synthetase alpha chain